MIEYTHILNENGDMMDNVLSHITNIGREFNIKVVLFGSRARMDNTPKSDYDIAFFTPLNFKVLEEIDNIETLHKIDVVFIDENTDAKLLENIEKDGVILYE